MALIVSDKHYDWFKELVKTRNDYDKIMYFNSAENVQHKFCFDIESSLLLDEPFLENPKIKKYLSNFGVTYTGDFMFQSEKWIPKKQFVTYLNYPLQMSCIMLYWDMPIYVILNRYLYDLEYLLPIIKEKDVYLIVDDYSDCLSFLKVVEKGAELIINGKNTKDMDLEELVDYLDLLYDEASFLTPKVDEKHFPADYKNTYLFEPYKTNLWEYILEHENNSTYLKSFQNSLVDTRGFLKNVAVLVNGKTKFDGSYRRYPIHWFIQENDDWKYCSCNSVKYPSTWEIFNEMFYIYDDYDTHDDFYFFENKYPKDNHYAEHELALMKAENIFALVLNCDGVCDVSEYWKHVSIVAKYNRKEKIIEICNMEKGIYEFHEMFQKLNHGTGASLFYKQE